MTKKHRSSKRKPQGQLDFQVLEPRQLLAVEIGINFIGAEGGADSTYTPANATGAVGPDHIVHMTNGFYSVYDTSGAQLESSSADAFWDAAGATRDSLTFDPRVVYDVASERFFASSVEAGVGNQIFLAVSNSSDPTMGWTSFQFVGDSTGTHSNVYDTLGVDGEGVYITTNNMGGSFDVSIYSFPKSDLVSALPTISNMTRFEGLNENIYGSSIQVANNIEPIVEGAVALGTMESGGTQIFRSDLDNTNSAGATLSAPVSITVPAYLPAPGGRQPGGVLLESVSPRFTGNIIHVDGHIWAAHAVEGSTGNSAIRWYKINEATNAIAEMGTIEDPDVDYLDPSISINRFGVVGIGMTATGPAQFASAAMVMAHTETGLEDSRTIFGEVRILRQGLEDYVLTETGTNKWTDYSATVVDPDDPFSFYTFQTYAAESDLWNTRITETGAFDISPTVRADGADNDIRIRTSVENAGWMEVVIDGIVTDIFETRSVNVLNLEGLGGNDTVTLDLSMGSPIPLGGITVRGGDGYDTFVVESTLDHTWTVDGDGSGNIDNLLRFLNFEDLMAGSGVDTFNIESTDTDLRIFGGEGDDNFQVTGMVSGSLTLLGQLGDDTYGLVIGAASNVDIIDSVDAENDRLVALGTNDADEIIVEGDDFFLNGVQQVLTGFPGIESIGVDGRGGADTFQIRETTGSFVFLGGGGNDVFNFSSDAGVMDGDTFGINFDQLVDGGEGRNRIVISNNGAPIGSDVVVTSDTITGMLPGTLTYIATGGGYSVNNGLAGLLLIGSDGGDDTFDVQTLMANATLRIEGRDGDDEITIRKEAEGNVDVDGQGGDDTYDLELTGMINRQVFFADQSGSGDVLRVTASDSVNIVTVANRVLNSSGEVVVMNESIDRLELNTLGGDDIVTISGPRNPVISVDTGAGDDELTLDGNRGIESFTADTGDGNDVIRLTKGIVKSFVSIDAGAGDDSFFVERAMKTDVVIDGQDGSDVYNIDFVGTASRVVTAKDSGATGTDVINANGTGDTDRIDLRVGFIERQNERILFDGNTEELKAELGNGNDIVNVYGSSIALNRIYSRAGNDSLYVNSTVGGGENFIFDMGIGNDFSLVTNTAVDTYTGIFGQGGKDDFVIGANAGADDGDLSLIRGRVRASGGGNLKSQEDRLYVNDRGSAGAFNYFVDGSTVSNLNDGVSPARENFAGIGYGTMEMVRLDGTDLRNYFSVRPSATTRFYIDGNLPVSGRNGDFLNLLGDPEEDGRDLTITGVGEGVWKFANSFRNVNFEEIEGMTGVTPIDLAGSQLLTRPAGSDADDSSSTARGRLAELENVDFKSGPWLMGDTDLDNEDEEEVNTRKFASPLDSAFAELFEV